MFCLFGRAEECIRLCGLDELVSSGQPVMSEDEIKLELSMRASDCCVVDTLV